MPRLMLLIHDGPLDRLTHLLIKSALMSNLHYSTKILLKIQNLKINNFVVAYVFSGTRVAELSSQELMI